MESSMSENYQLKWHSFGSYLHSSVAGSLNSASDSSAFTDVVLFTIDGHQLLAHRFILSACSQYLGEILRAHCKVSSTLPLLIVLPAEINYKTLKILMQYMYSGEATVSKDILESVLRGGDLLKVKGLWRPREDEYQPEKRLVKVGKHRRAQEPERRKQPTRPERPFSVLKSTKSVEVGPSENGPEANEDGREREDGASKAGKAGKNRSDTVIADKENLNCGTTSSAASTSSATSSYGFAADEHKPSVGEQLLVIKEEPLEWTEAETEEEAPDGDAFDEEITIKAEVLIDDKDQDADEQELSNGDNAEEIYSPLTCELCSETFALPADWVRHIQTHTDMMPAKRQRRGKSSTDDDNVSSGNFPPLHCDMCQKYYPTPAEWVHHIQNTHTEFELRLSNKNNNAPSSGRVPPLIKTGKSPQLTTQTASSGGGGVGHTPKICAVCNKKFPSHASMLIHKRTHTGEKPYTCEFCFKGFNVKSNLLRHLRTLHDRIINSAEVESKEDSNADS